MKYRKRYKHSTSLKQEQCCFDNADRWLAKNDKPRITRAEVEKLRTPKGGFRKKDLEALGVAWPPKKGWLKELVGNEPFVNTLPNPGLPAGRFVYRSNKPDFCYHIRTEGGTVCNMQNSTAYNRLDAVSDTPPAGRRACRICEAVQMNDRQRVPWERLESW